MKKETPKLPPPKKEPTVQDRLKAHIFGRQLGNNPMTMALRRHYGWDR